MSETGDGEGPGSPTGLSSGHSLDVIVAALSLSIVGGVAWDIRRHSEGISFAAEGFATLEHVVIYASFAGVSIAIGLATILRRRTGHTWFEAVPRGYRWGVLGIGVFALGGFGDVLWHSAFGFEQGFQALVSPSHLALAVGSTLLLGSPLRGAWRREGAVGGVAVLPAVVSAGLVLTVIVLFGGFLNPIMRLDFAFGADGAGRAMAVSSIVLFPLALLCTGLVLCRRFALPLGGLTVCFGIPGIASGVAGHTLALVPAVVVAGVVADGLVAVWSPRPGATRAVRGFGTLVPLSFAASYVLLLQRSAGVPWSVHVWAGTVVMAGLAGLLVTYVVDPGWSGEGPRPSA